MDKTKLINQISETTINNTKVNILNAAGEVALNIFHSIYPERLYTLLFHFYLLYAIKDMKSADIDEFLRICNDHKMKNAAVICLSLTEIIQEMCFGESPYKITDLREAFGKHKQIEIPRIPYLFPLKMVLNSFWGKRNDLVFTMSVVQQIISMLNPNYARYVVRVYKDRNNRDTY
jgi:hypothetical protein